VVLDGDPGRDHAVGPMQFIPSTWRKWGTDANGDGKADPGNIVDAATAAGRYLCRAAGDLTLGTEAGVIRAILSYNPNQTYLRVVGARFEALASDLALGWFSAATLPPAPAPWRTCPERRPGRTGGDGNSPPSPRRRPRPSPRSGGPQDLTTSTTAPVTIPPGECTGPTWPFDPCAGFLRCGPTGALLDPCEVAPYDATLVGCLPDPTGTPVLLRLAGPAPTARSGPPAVPAAGPGRRRSLPAHPGNRADPASAAVDDDHPDDGRRDEHRRPPRVPRRPPRAPRARRPDAGRPRRDGRGSTTTTATTAAARLADDLHGDLGDRRDGDGRGDDLGRAHSQGAPRRPGRLDDLHRASGDHVGADHDHPARRAADLRVRERRSRHRAAEQLEPDLGGPRPALGRPGLCRRPGPH
jgi:hypothetical protein